MKTSINLKLLLILSFLLINLSVITTRAQNKTMNSPKTSGYAPVNGLKLYYEVYGEGKPIVLLHGSYMTINLNYGQLIPELVKTHKVIAIEMQGHGHTADIDRPFSYAALADDVDGLLKYLKIENADILGYSLGATVGLELAIKHPAVVNKLVFISSVFKYDGWIQATRDVFPTMKPEFLEKTPLKTEYDKAAPDKTHWTAFVTKLIKFDSTPFDLGADNVKAIKAPVLIIKGDNDGVDLGHVAEMYTLCGGGVFGDMAGLPKSQLAIIPAATHVSLMMKTQKLATLINPFLDKNP
jgi:pimeloyl-ACP methyl ester carboxylesterase